MIKVSHAQVASCADFDWAGCPFDRHSTFGYFVMVRDNLVSWMSKT